MKISEGMSPVDASLINETGHWSHQLYIYSGNCPPPKNLLLACLVGVSGGVKLGLGSIGLTKIYFALSATMGGVKLLNQSVGKSGSGAELQRSTSEKIQSHAEYSTAGPGLGFNL